MWIFSTREIATAVYITIIIIGNFISQKIRPAAINVIKAACSKKLVIPFIIILLYASAFVFIFTYFPFWDWAYLKDIIIWVLFAGVPVCFNAISKTIEKHYFRNMILDNLKFAALVEFFTGTFTFNIVVELVLQPVLVFFVLLQTIAGTKDEYKSIKRLMNWVVSIFGIIILGFTIRNAVVSYNDMNTIDLIFSFFLPIVLSLLYLPFAHGFVVYAKYEMLFIRMGFKEPKNLKIRLKHRWKIILLCKFSYNKVCMFEKEYAQRMYVTMKDAEFESIIKDFKEAQ